MTASKLKRYAEGRFIILLFSNMEECPSHPEHPTLRNLVFIFFFLVVPLLGYFFFRYVYETNIQDEAKSCLAVEERCLSFKTKEGCGDKLYCFWHEEEDICCFVGNYAMEKVLGAPNCCPKDEFCNETEE